MLATVTPTVDQDNAATTEIASQNLVFAKRIRTVQVERPANPGHVKHHLPPARKTVIAPQTKSVVQASASLPLLAKMIKIAKMTRSANTDDVSSNPKRDLARRVPRTMNVSTKSVRSSPLIHKHTAPKHAQHSKHAPPAISVSTTHHEVTSAKSRQQTVNPHKSKHQTPRHSPNHKHLIKTQQRTHKRKTQPHQKEDVVVSQHILLQRGCC